MTSKPRLLFVTTEFPFPAQNGITNKISNYLKRLPARFDVTLVSFFDPTFVGPPDAASVNDARNYASEVHVLSQQPRSFRPLARLEPPFVARYRTAASRALIADLTSKKTFDVIHLDCLGSVSLAPSIRRRPRVLVASPNDVYSLMLEGRDEDSPIRSSMAAFNRWLVRRYERKTYPAFDQLHFVSQVDCDYAKKLAPSLAPAWVPLGVELPKLPAIAEEPHTLVFVANMLEGHGGHIVEFVRETLPLIRAQVPDVRLMAVGPHPPPELTEIARADSSITVTGFVDDTAPYLARGSVALCLNTLLGGMQTKVLGAMAMGKPVVGLPQNFVAIKSAENGVHFVSARGREEFAAETVALFRSPERRQRIGRAARELLATEYGWDRVIEKYLALIGTSEHGPARESVRNYRSSRAEQTAR